MRKTHIPALIGAVLLCLSLSGCQKAPPPDASPAPPEPPAQSQAAPDPEPVPEPVPEPDPLPEPDPEPAPEPSPEPASEPEPDPPNTTLYVLMYHHFAQEGELCNDWMVTGARFREDLQWLAGHGYETVLPSQLAKGEPLPRKAVMLTFDDGYISNYGLAYPILQEYGYKAAISIIVSYVEDPDSPYLSWDMCREMVDSGLVEIGSHTYACHEEENGIKRRKNESREDYESRVLTDLQTSIDLIRDNLGVAPSLFAYPNGKTEEWAKDFIRSHFAVTVTTRHGPANISQGLYNLNRCNVSMKAPVSKILPD